MQVLAPDLIGQTVDIRITLLPGRALRFSTGQIVKVQLTFYPNHPPARKGITICTLVHRPS